MKILIDIGHPAHVHYFKNFIRIMEKKGHDFLIVARDKEVTYKLLKCYNIDFTSRGKGKRSLLGKVFYSFRADMILYKLARKWQPDFLMSFGSPYTAHVSKLIGKPHISLTDTEHARLGILAFAPFSETILTPSSFNAEFGTKHIRFNSYMDLCYLHPNYFKPDSSILDLLKVKKDEKYIILRFVSWDASHDVGHTGLTMEMKEKLVNIVTKYAKVFISSEGELPEKLKKYQIKIPVEKMHDALYYATLYIGEGGTMASEAAVLGTPSIFINTLTGGVVEELEEYDLLYGFRNSDGVLEKVLDLLKTQNLIELWQKRKEKMLADKIDATAFMVWFIENYPSSIKIMKENADFVKQFK